MSLTPGARLGPYEILAPLGAGGMGEVHRARDMRLGRDVAIKIIPDHVASDPERIARFEREARLLASLRHPNIATLHGLENVDGQRFIVMECIEGETLSHRLAGGPLPLREALDVCRQIATALEAAHEGGVIHRDLKPGNVQVTPEGDVRVLDFGLAKANEASTSLSDLSQSPTLSRREPTNVGVILGTAAYMSPEQARGKPVDRRTDIWSFGAVLYECLTGRQCFAGETLSDTIAMILEREIDWRVLPRNTPLRVRQLLARCLERDPRKRLRDAGEARIALEMALAGLESGTEPSAEARASWWTPRRLIPLAIAGLAGAAITFAAVRGLSRGGGADTPVVRYAIDVPEGRRMSVDDFIAAAQWDVSPDGQRVVARLQAPAGATTPLLYARRLAETEWRPVTGSERSRGFPVFSADSRTLFFASTLPGESGGGRVMRVGVEDGSTPVAVCDIPEEALGVLPVAGGRLAFLHVDNKRFALWSAGANGPPAWKPIERGAFDGNVNADIFAFSPALGRDEIFLGTTQYLKDGWHRGTAILNVRSGKLTPVLQDGQWPALLPSGVLVFSRGTSVMAIRFDRGARRTKGEAVPILTGVRTRGDWLPARFRVTERGDLLYVSGTTVGDLRSLQWVDARGTRSPFTSVSRAYSGDPSATPDGRRITTTVTNARGFDEIWTFEGGDRTGQRTLWEDGADVSGPVLSRDGQWIAFARQGVDGSGQVMVSPFAGDVDPRPLTRPSGLDSVYRPQDWFPDGRRLLGKFRTSISQARLVLIDVTALRPPRVLLPGYNVGWAVVSPDGRSVAFDSDRSGRTQVYVCAISPEGVTSAPVAVARSGRYPAWAAGGRSVSYIDSATVHDVQVSTAGAIAAGADRAVYSMGDDTWDAIRGGTVLPDGRSLYLMTDPQERGASRIEVIQNWVSSVRSKLPR